ncbi:proline iminopeptidase-family hydrolase [Christiangramia forsetii]|uniref:Proline iminopeptidase n=2 Tax=Christiangramia forsetii TaxID=411153 RepID=A0LZN2_CHRFK|nr:proline iminopeptidase-family hydrolase [Christiangramia forsetii]GGG38701.1 amino acid amidase [Christiangramia forsetii]CAL65827.1 proline iminopeptidase [Christiangramia forsetii KT0803]
MNSTLRNTASIFLGITLIYAFNSCNKIEEKEEEGYIEVTGGKVWYQINGKGDKTPVLLLHGGPGSSSYGFDPYKKLSNDRPIIFFDQLGSGRSDRITDTTLMTVERYVEEVEHVRKELDLEKFILHGQSWGTALGLEYYLKYPKHVEGIIFSSPYFSTKRWIKDANELVKTLPDSIQSIIRTNEKNKTFSNEEYKDAVALFYSKFLRRKERTQAQKDTATKYFGTNVYEYMWGPSEFTATGTLLNYDRIDKLSEVEVPVLFITGEYDEARPSTVRYYQNLVPNAEFSEISNSGHATLNDNPEEALSVIEKFLEKIDKINN